MKRRKRGLSKKNKLGALRVEYVNTGFGFTSTEPLTFATHAGLSTRNYEEELGKDGKGGGGITKYQIGN